MNKKLAIKNSIFAILLQITTMISGFIIPRIILTYFGSEINGLISSITQLLNYIQLLEGGLTGVIMAALYKSLANNDNKKTSAIIIATKQFFRKIGLVFITYSIILGLIYPLITKTSFSYWYVSSLVSILAVSTFIQYFFALSFRVLINADRHGYIVSIVQIVFIVLNVVLVYISVMIFPEIHLLKAISAFAFIIQPIMFGRYVKKHYCLDKKVGPDNEAICQRWDAFGQNLAFFIHTNTDIVVLTLFANLSVVSVYSIYLLVINAVKNLILAISGAIQPSFGNVLATKNNGKINEAFNFYEYVISVFTTFSFSCCLVLIVPFVELYTKGITDANYYQPLFAIIIVIAEGIYSLRDPYIAVSYAAGHFKATSIHAYVEAGINIVLSICFVHFWGLIGVAIGTVVAMTYRLIAHIIYAKNNIIYRNAWKSLKGIGLFFFVMIGTYVVIKYLINFQSYSIADWLLLAIISVGVSVVLIVVYSIVIYRKEIGVAIKSMLNKCKR